MIYDISLPLSPRLACWPGDPTIESSTFGDAVKVSRWTLGSHAGTHVDAPSHFSVGPDTVDQLDPAVLLGPCCMVEIYGAPVITPEVLTDHLVCRSERILLRTRNSLHWQENPEIFDPHYVGLDLAAAEMLLQRGVKLIGIDGLSVEPYGGNGEIHRLLLSAGVIILEGLNLAEVPSGEYQLICAPLKLAGADGAPARVWLIG